MGKSKPNISVLRSLFPNRKGVFPAGYAAANMLGFSTQNAAKIEVATTGLSLPRLNVGGETIIYTRRPEAWMQLSSEDAAILDFIRRSGKTSELSPDETVKKLLKFFAEPGRFERLLKVVESEPPRVRAILGAIGQEIGFRKTKLIFLQKSLHPLSRFDFGKLSSLKFSQKWQSKGKKHREVI